MWNNFCNKYLTNNFCCKEKNVYLCIPLKQGALAERLGTGLQNLLQQFDSARHLNLLVISFSVINYVVSMRCPS